MRSKSASSTAERGGHDPDSTHAALIAANVVSDTASACGANTAAARPSSRSKRARPTAVCSSTITIALPLPT